MRVKVRIMDNAIVKEDESTNNTTDDEQQKQFQKQSDLVSQGLQDFIFTSKYARWLPHLKRRETWDEATDRVCQMHLEKYHWLTDEDKDKIRWAFSLVKDKRVLPSMRSMQFGGKAQLAHECRGYNCSVRHVDSIRAFAEIAYLMLCGCGTGIGLSKRFLGRLPNLVSADDKTGSVITYVIEDTIEGWADSIEALLQCYFKNNAYTGRKIIFDYSKIRRKGSILKTGGGRAPGYKPLKAAHGRIKRLLDHIIEEENISVMRPIHAYDVLMHFADAVLSGGIRRTASSIIFELSDDELMNAKTYFKVDKYRESFDKELNEFHMKVWVGGKSYDVTLSRNNEFDKFTYDSITKENTIGWKYIEPQRARSNNSVLLLRNETTLEQFRSIIDKSRQFGEPGFVFEDSNDVLKNPCLAGDNIIVTDLGNFTVKELVGKQFNALVNGKEFPSTKEGFWSTGIKEVVKLTFQSGRTARFTDTHELLTLYGWKRIKDMQLGESIVIHNHTPHNEASLSTFSYARQTIMRQSLDILVEIKEDGIEEVYDCTIEDVHAFDCNGLYTKNCYEISFIPINNNNDNGVQFCNLTTVNGNKIEDRKQLEEAVLAQTIIGTCQAGYTNFSYLSNVAKEITDEEALLGNSMTGVLSNPKILLDAKILKSMAEFAVTTNEEWAQKLNINPAARVTALKPEGTGSLAIGVQEAGIHAAHSEQFLRRVQTTKGEPVYEFFKAYNPHLCEESVWSANKTDDVITFPMNAKEGGMVKDDLTAIEHLEIIRKVQENWVVPGGKNSKKPITNSVSCTVMVRENEWDEVIDYIYKYRNSFAAVSLLDYFGDKIYEQAPLEKISTEKEKKRFRSLIEKYKPVDYTKLKENQDETTHTEEMSCAGGACLI